MEDNSKLVKSDSVFVVDVFRGVYFVHETQISLSISCDGYEIILHN